MTGPVRSGSKGGCRWAGARGGGDRAEDAGGVIRGGWRPGGRGEGVGAGIIDVEGDLRAGRGRKLPGPLAEPSEAPQ